MSATPEPTIHVLPSGQRVEGEVGAGWPVEVVAPVTPLDPRRPTPYEIWAALGRVEPYGA